MEIDKIVQANTRQEWRKWLSGNHSTEDYCWLLSTDKQSVSYLDCVEEALCFIKQRQTRT
jgi:uncharacterized protein YdeI (YjbR/CyaY-like superfamily)